jgi:orotidine-5'-phosphate decarboxylase
VRDRICLALDFSTRAEASSFARRFSGRAGWFKVGLELFVSEGPGLVTEIAAHGQVFLDLKLHDIPNTVARACAAAAATGASMVNVHASGGREMMARALGAVSEEAARRGLERPRLIAVTLLTSLGEKELASLPYSGTPGEIVERLALLARESGLDGVVCSAEELSRVRRACGDGFLTVVPGIRPAGSAAGDQKRVATPRAAIEAGASLLVVGRPVTQATDPEAALKGILAEISL